MTVEIYIGKKMRDEIYLLCPRDEYAVPTGYQRERRVLEDYALGSLMRKTMVIVVSILLSFHKNYE